MLSSTTAPSMAAHDWVGHSHMNGSAPSFEPTLVLGENTTNMDAILAEELNQLSLEDREMISDEIHGVHTLAVHETPELIIESLSQMELALLETTRQHNHLDPRHDQVHATIGWGTSHNGHVHHGASITGDGIYSEALRLGSQYVHDPAFRLMFLRAEQFDATKAAGRLVKFLQLIREYLGPEYLVTQPWQLAVFTAEELNLFKRGNLQLLPGRDRSGRRMIGVVENYGGNVHIPSLIKILLYVHMVAAEDEQTQQRGNIMIFYQSNPSSKALFRVEERVAIQKLNDSVPLRTSAHHLCLPDNPLFAMVKTLAMTAVTRMQRTRMRFHSGSPTEILYSLQTFGISPDQVPINTSKGTVKTQSFLKWINMRQAMEAAKASGRPNNNPFQGIECPMHEDVLLGRGRPIWRHGGNIAMRHAVEARLARFAATTDKKVRAAIIWEVIQEIHQLGGRFLKEDPGKNGWWVEVDSNAAKLKVGICFRDRYCFDKANPSTTKSIEGPTLTSMPPNPPSSTLGMSQAGHNSNKGVTTIPSRRQEFDSSTYEFVEGTSRNHKRYKASHHNEICGNWTFCGT